MLDELQLTLYARKATFYLLRDSPSFKGYLAWRSYPGVSLMELCNISSSGTVVHHNCLSAQRGCCCQAVELWGESFATQCLPIYVHYKTWQRPGGTQSFFGAQTFITLMTLIILRGMKSLKGMKKTSKWHPSVEYGFLHNQYRHCKCGQSQCTSCLNQNVHCLQEGKISPRTSCCFLAGKHFWDFRRPRKTAEGWVAVCLGDWQNLPIAAKSARFHLVLPVCEMEQQSTNKRRSCVTELTLQ